MLPAEPSGRHRAAAGHFGDVVAGVAGWDAPTPVPGWTARDVVRHLVGWLPPVLVAGAGIELKAGPPVDDDPVGAWRHHSDAVQRVLDDPAVASATFEHTPMPSMTVASAVDMIYTSDVFMHTWDLARASGQDDRLDPDECARLLAGMVPMEEALRSSGQYGPALPVADGAAAHDRLIAFIGRDPTWQPPSAAGG